MPFDAERIALDPFTASVSVLHVVAPAESVVWPLDELVRAHRARGWIVDVTVTSPAGPELVTRDVVVLHGRSAGRERRRLRGATTTVLVVAPGGPAWSDVVGERLLSRWTNVVVVPDASTADRWTRRVPVPLARVDDADPDVVAGVLVRAAAMGLEPSRQPAFTSRSSYSLRARRSS